MENISSNIIFLNLDVDLESNESLAAIADSLGDSVVVMFVGENNQSHTLSLELAGILGSPDYLTQCFVTVLSSMSLDATTALSSCNKIDFNFGFEGSSGNLETNLSQESVAGIAKLNGSISTTIYSGS